ncbi:Nuclear transcription factor Y subunit B-3 [Linum perenne]
MVQDYRENHAMEVRESWRDTWTKACCRICRGCLLGFCNLEGSSGEASNKCQREKRKTINGDDLLWAMTTLGFEEYVEPLKIYLQKYWEMEGEKSPMGGREKSSSSLF